MQKLKKKFFYKKIKLKNLTKTIHLIIRRILFLQYLKPSSKICSILAIKNWKKIYLSEIMFYCFSMKFSIEKNIEKVTLKLIK